MNKTKKGIAEPCEFFTCKPANIDSAIEYKIPCVDEESNFIYFLLKNGVIVYVGKTRCVQSRVNQHLKEKDFDSVYFDPKPYTQNESLAVELQTILKHDPILNTGYCEISNCGFTSVAKFRKRFFPRPSTVCIKKILPLLSNVISFRGESFYDPSELKAVYEREYDCELVGV